MSKSSDKKTKSMRINKHVSANMVAETVGCNACFVRQVWAGTRRSEKKKGEGVEVATIILQECINQGMIKAKKLIGEVQNN